MDRIPVLLVLILIREEAQSNRERGFASQERAVAIQATASNGRFSSIRSRHSYFDEMATMTLSIIRSGNSRARNTSSLASQPTM